MFQWGALRIQAQDNSKGPRAINTDGQLLITKGLQPLKRTSFRA